MYPTRINTRKRGFLGKAASLFNEKNEHDDKQKETDTERLYAQTGQLKVENDFLKKMIITSVKARREDWRVYQRKE